MNKRAVLDYFAKKVEGGILHPRKILITTSLNGPTLKKLRNCFIPGQMKYQQLVAGLLLNLLFYQVTRDTQLYAGISKLYFFIPSNSGSFGLANWTKVINYYFLGISYLYRYRKSPLFRIQELFCTHYIHGGHNEGGINDTVRKR